MKINAMTGALLLGLLPVANKVGTQGTLSRRSEPTASTSGVRIFTANFLGQKDQPQLKDTHSPAMLEPFSYNKGDDATTIGEFQQALAGDYLVTFNDNAKDPNKFMRRITVYGENHLYPKLPSIPGGRGMVMLESNDEEVCRIEKYKQQTCVHIDHPDLSSEKAALGRRDQAIFDLLNELDPKAIEEVESSLTLRATTHEFTNKAIQYAMSKIKEYKASGNKEKFTSAMVKFDKAAAAIVQAGRHIESRLDVRDKHMFNEAKTHIERLGPDEGATVVLGFGHLDKFVASVTEAFPERAIVKCQVVGVNKGG